MLCLHNKILKLIFICIMLIGCCILPFNNAYADIEGDQMSGGSVRDADDEDYHFNEMAICNSMVMKERYMGEDVADSCWFCKVVVIMTNAFLLAANDALGVCQELGHLIVRLGFMIWLGLFVLKHVTSFAPITPGKMLQELLVMGFKCAVANFAISDGINFITSLILNPIMITGTDIGYTLLEGLIEYNTDL